MITLVLLMVFVAILTAIAVAVGLASWRLDVRNRVEPGRSSPAPTSWLIAPTDAAGLHRRLRDLATTVRRAGPLPSTPVPGSTDELRFKILQQAVLLDHEVVALSRAPKRHRREAMHRIRMQVHELESLSRRVIELSARTHPRIPLGVDRPEVALGDIAERVHLLEAAEAELADIERANGLLDPERLIQQSPPPQLPGGRTGPIPTMPGPRAAAPRPPQP